MYRKMSVPDLEISHYQRTEYKSSKIKKGELIKLLTQEQMCCNIITLNKQMVFQMEKMYHPYQQYEEYFC